MIFPQQGAAHRSGTHAGDPTNTNARTCQTVLNVAEEVTGCECKANLANNNRTIANEGTAGSFYDLVPGWNLYCARANHLRESSPGRALSRLDPLHPDRGRRSPGLHTLPRLKGD